LSEGDALLLQSGDPGYARFQNAYNLRTARAPLLRALCKTPGAVAAMVDWCRTHRLPFALRSGGHSFEGLSQSDSVVIDVRLLDHVRRESDGSLTTVGTGATLGKIYRELAPYGLTVPAGTCTTVGIAGHALGGGYGLLARAYGLTCDCLQSVRVVDSEGRIVDADAERNPDLFWACRGGGGGSFGAVVVMRFKPQPVENVRVFGMSWALPPDRAARLFSAWLRWAPEAPRSITSVLKFGKRRDGAIALRCAGQSIGDMGELTAELRGLTDLERPRFPPRTDEMSFMEAVGHFAGGESYQSVHMKGKSDYLPASFSEDTAQAIMAGVARLDTTQVVAICDAYGGAIADAAPDATAFVSRAGVACSVQYHASWDNSDEAASRISQLEALYGIVHAHATGGAYLNYGDLDLPDWADAYWGQNLPRLRSIKSRVDPDNVFRHAQSVPLAR
jgi:FAD/FMN-containing dehydrogenase